MVAEIEYQVDIDEFLEYLHKKENIEGSGLERAMCVVLKPKFVNNFLEIKVLYDKDQSPSEWRDYETIKYNWENQQTNER